MSAVVPDTYVIVWYISDYSRLSPAAIAALDGATQVGDPIYVSPISLVEITYLIERNKLPQIVLDQLVALLNDPNSELTLMPLDLSIAQALRRIPRATVPEMPDRIIAATALQLNLPLVTRDLSIGSLNVIQTIW
jgi:PIN domain nuclease of toxin-antitoxin system